MSDLVLQIRAGLRDAADSALAPGQQAYMKSAMPFLGVRVPEARRVARAAGRDATPAELLETAIVLWDEASHREERYAAMALLGLRSVKADAVIVPIVDHMVRTGQWWDYTDELAHRLAELHDAHGPETAALVREWSIDDDLWIRRIAIISQLGRRDRVDSGLLADVIEPNRSHREFFIRKAIGWALREYARVSPDWVRTYVDTHELSPLSRREALKHL
ncbi:DNA alkylation repair protein [Microbacterium aoyamense]|uniref:DNA alkylation repair protein n=1 Tax=Microbacterium aoyamense TaxID=344166 RepID=A0ABP5AFW5_9MICO|nr:DNA alkylation repair protein [Microbacterium aoyamense]